MSTTLRDPDTGNQITVPDGVAQSYVSQGWVLPGSPTPAEPGLDSLTIPMLRDFAGENGVELAGLKRKPEIIAAIEKALGPAA
ncbi:Rho termination factor N-terminal domain-containing protein [Microbacterium maritypicum]